MAIILPLALFMTIDLPDVQTFIVKKLTKVISDKTQTKVSIASVNYELFSKLAVRKIYVEDHFGDTLVYVERLRVAVSSIGLTTKVIHIGSVRLSDGQFNLSNNNGEVNIQRFIESLSAPKDTTIVKPEGTPLMVKVSSVALDNFKFNMKRIPQQHYDDSSRINFSDLRVDSIYLDIQKIALANDTLFFDINKLSCREKSGFRLRKLSANGYVCSTQAMLKNLQITDDYTDLQLGFFSLNFKSDADLKFFIEKVKLDAKFDGGILSLKTIGHFAPALAHIETPLNLKGFVSGTVENLKSDSLFIQTADAGASILLKFRLQGLPDINGTSIYADIKQLQANGASALSLYSDISKGKEAPISAYLLATHTLSYQGRFVGLYNDFVTDGRLATSLGSLNMYALFASNRSKTTFKGHFQGFDCYLGALLNSPALGTSSFDLEMEGGVAPSTGLHTTAKGEISLLEFNGYAYSNITMNGRLGANDFDGNVKVDDPNLQLTFAGWLNNLGLSDSIPDVNFKAEVTHADLYALKLNKRDSISTIRGDIVANFKGNSWNNGVGLISLNKVSYTDNYGTIGLGGIRLMAEQAKRSYRINLDSDYLNARYTGTAGVETMVSEVVGQLRSTLPSLFAALDPQANQDQKKKISTTKTADDVKSSAATDPSDVEEKHSYKVEVETKRLENVVRIFIPNLYIAEGSTISASMSNGKLLLDANFDKVYFKLNQARNIKVHSETSDSTILFDVSSDEINNGGSLFIRNLKAQSEAVADSIDTNLSYDNGTKEQNHANISISTLLQRIDGELSAKFGINQSQVVLNNTPWDLLCEAIQVGAGNFRIDGFVVSNNDQKAQINGSYASVDDTLSLVLDGFKLSSINDLLSEQGYTVDGTIKGNASLIKKLDSPLFFLNLHAADVLANGHDLENIDVESVWNNQQEKLELKMDVGDYRRKMLGVVGSYTPKSSYLDLAVATDSLPLVLVEPFMEGVVSKIEGGVSTNLQLEGVPGSLKLIGTGKVLKAGFTVDYLNTHYSLRGDIRAEQNRFSLNNANLKDEAGNSAVLNATVMHDFFKNFDFNIGLRLNKLMVLNTTAKHNDIFYGKGYASGDVTIKGLLNSLNINVTATTEKNTAISILMPAATAREGSELLTFYIPPPVEQEKKSEGEEAFLASIMSKQKGATEVKKNNLSLHLGLDVNTNAEVQFIIDPKTNDMVKSVGSGSLQMDIVPSLQKFMLYGAYTIDKGTYVLTIPSLNLLTHSFILDKGSTISFGGDMSRMNLDITATYDKLVKTQIAPLIPESGPARYQVQCKVNVNGYLSDLKIKPIINVLNVDSDTEAKLQSAMSTDEKLLTQFFSLLALGTFLPEQSLGQVSFNGGNIGLDILTGQISSLFSELNLPVNLDVSVKNSEYTSVQEVDIGISSVIGDKIILSGSVGNTNTSNASRSIAGDFDVEYLWTPSVSVKLFSHSNDPYSDMQGGSRYGGAISYQNRFSSFRDLFKRKKKVAASASTVVKSEAPAVDTTKNAASERVDTTTNVADTASLHK